MSRMLAAIWLISLLAGCVSHQDTVSSKVSQELVSKIVALVETHGLPPADQHLFDQRKKELIAFAAAGGEIDRKTLYQRAQATVELVADDKHSFIRRIEKSAVAPVLDGPLRNDYFNDSVRTLKHEKKAALIICPPAFPGIHGFTTKQYVDAMRLQLKTIPANINFQLLVVDLRKQTGGGAYAPLIVLRSLLSKDNQAFLIDRHGNRQKILDYLLLIEQSTGYDKPDEIFKPMLKKTIAILVSNQTASAGEMVAITLMGELGNRVLVGTPTSGFTTANSVFELPDNATLALSTHRYSLFDQVPITGKLMPKIKLSGPDETMIESLLSFY